jgi:hypothetical protein
VTAARRPERGLVRGCCLLIVLLVVVLGAAAYFADRALAAPSLGAAPAGPDHGDTEAAIAVALGVQLAAELLTEPHGVVTLSEHDLTVLARAHNPHPNSLSNLTARIRDGLVVISADHPFGPFTVTPVARIAISLASPNTSPSVSASIVELDVGQLVLPGFLRDREVGSLAPTLSLNALFGASAALQAVRASLECIVIAPDGVRVGVHRPATAPDPSVCGA